MKKKHLKTLTLLFKRPTSGNVKWLDVKALLISLGATIKQREGSRVLIVLFKDSYVLHLPHPSPCLDKGAVASIRNWLTEHGVTP